MSVERCTCCGQRKTSVANGWVFVRPGLLSMDILTRPITVQETIELSDWLADFISRNPLQFSR